MLQFLVRVTPFITVSIQHCQASLLIVILGITGAHGPPLVNEVVVVGLGRVWPVDGVECVNSALIYITKFSLKGGTLLLLENTAFRQRPKVKFQNQHMLTMSN